MAKRHGLTMILAIDTGGGTYVDVGFQRSTTLSMSMEDIDATTKESDYWREREPSIKECSMDFEGHFDDANAAQDQLWTNFETSPSAKANARISLAGEVWTVNSLLSELTLEGSHEELVTASGSLVSDGALTRV